MFGLQVTINHEFIHSWQWAEFGHKMDHNVWTNYTEVSAYAYTNQYTKSIIKPAKYIYNGDLDIYNWPELPSIQNLINK